MDRVLSVRVSEESYAELEQAAEKLGISKKRFVEEAIKLRSEQAKPSIHEAIARAAGAWKRDEPPEETVRRIREQVEKDYSRYWRNDD